MQETYDERVYTAHAEAGWSAWNQFSPEVEFCQFLGQLRQMVQPHIIVETGTGAGKVTLFLGVNPNSPPPTGYYGFEADQAFRKASDHHFPKPSAEQMASAHLVILDSDPPWRFDEIALWGRVGKPGSVCVIHDCGNGHPENSLHMQFRRAVEELGITGRFLSNPRGGWLGVHP